MERLDNIKHANQELVGVNLSDVWKKSSNEKMRDILNEQLTRDLPKGSKISINFNENTGKISRLFLENAEHKFEFKYLFEEEGAEFASGRVAEESRGKGIARKAKRNFFNFFMENNLKTLSMAATEMGPYVWAKMGFVPKAQQWPDVKEAVRRRMMDVYCMHGEELSVEDCEYIAATNKILYGKSKPKDLWKIVDMDRPFMDYEGLTWGKVLLLPSKELPPEIGIDHSSYDIEYIGDFNFEDKASLERAMNYFYPEGEKRPKLNIREDGNCALNVAKEQDNKTKKKQFKHYVS